jgi:hypothetical protein
VIDLLVGLVLASPQASGLQLGAQIHNYAEVPAITLEQAKDQTSNIFRRIGVRVVWSECALVGPGETSCANIEKDFVPPQHNFKIRILSQTLYPNESWKTGVALKGAGLANIFLDRVTAFVDSFRGQVWKESMTARVLAHAIAHELGHLLLPDDKVHSPTGIMRAQWNPGDFTATMRFTEEQVRYIRTALSRRF